MGTFVSSGCIRLTNEDVMDLYSRVKYSATIWMRTASGDQGVKRRPVAAL
ncbi:MAG: L,D-transpeptidase family protein [Sphingomonadales bacterium]